MELTVGILIFLNFISYNIGVNNGFNDGFSLGERYQKIQTVVQYDKAYNAGYQKSLEDVRTSLTDKYLDKLIEDNRSK